MAGFDLTDLGTECGSYSPLKWTPGRLTKSKSFGVSQSSKMSDEAEELASADSAFARDRWMTFPKSDVPETRLHGLDALRAIAMLLGVLLHSAIAYMPSNYQNVLWPVREPNTSRLCDWVFWGTHTFRLPTFFFLSGFFAEQLYSTRGEAHFIEHKRQRLLIPYLACIVSIMPLTLIVWTWGWLISGRCEWEAMSPLTLSFPSELWTNLINPGHLWFLLDLMVLNAGFALLRNEWRSTDESHSGWKIWQLHPAALTVVLAFVPAMLLWADASPFTDFHNSFLPDARRILYFSSFFTLGAAAYRRRRLFATVVRRPVFHVVAAGLFTGGAVWLITASGFDRQNFWFRALLGWSVALSAWSFILGTMGVAIHHCHRERPLVRYLADSSYWIYLIHLPIVGLAQIALRDVAMSPILKMMTVFVTASAVGLGSYVCVRHTVVGFYLHGPRKQFQDDCAPPNLRLPSNMLATDARQSHAA